mgnify:CR=1 FL=1
MSAIDCMVIVAHMDDESLSCGGLISRHLRAGHTVAVITVFDRKYNYGEGPQHLTEQMDAFEKAMTCLDSNPAVSRMDWRHLLFAEGEPGQQSYYQVLKYLESELDRLRPRQVVIHDDQDRNQDHLWLTTVCKIALRPFGNDFVDQILMCQSPDGLPKKTNYYVRMTKEVVDRKQDAVNCYAREARVSPHPRSPEMLKAWHQMHGSYCGAEFAEPYRLYYQRE